MKFTDKDSLDKLFGDDQPPPPPQHEGPGDYPGADPMGEGEGSGQPQEGDMPHPVEVPSEGQLPSEGSEEPAWAKAVREDWNLKEDGQQEGQELPEKFKQKQDEFMRRLVEMWRRMRKEAQEKRKPNEVEELMTILLLAVEGLVADFEAGLYEDFPEVKEEAVRKVRRFVREMVEAV